MQSFVINSSSTLGRHLVIDITEHAQLQLSETAAFLDCGTEMSGISGNVICFTFDMWHCGGNFSNLEPANFQQFITTSDVTWFTEAVVSLLIYLFHREKKQTSVLSCFKKSFRSRRKRG